MGAQLRPEDLAGQSPDGCRDLVSSLSESRRGPETSQRADGHTNTEEELVLAVRSCVIGHLSGGVQRTLTYVAL